ncbi:MAG: amino acid synthesis family protein [Thermoleophilia bacterium]|nr:amino acid synthesis family protein [Thermoleophilia bacterium]
MIIRKFVVQVEETLAEAGVPVTGRHAKVVAAAAIVNPCAGGSPSDDLAELEALGAEVAEILAQKALAALGRGTEVTAYGKGAIVGIFGELEHAAALLHPRFGAPVRSLVGGGPGIIPSTKKVGPAGAQLTMPLTGRDDVWSFDDMDAAEIVIGDAPRPNEIVVALVLATGGRPHARTQKPG